MSSVGEELKVRSKGGCQKELEYSGSHEVRAKEEKGVAMSRYNALEGQSLKVTL